MNPKVSIVIPVFNGSDYLRTAVQSALAQTYSNIEVIVVNDGSTDDGATQAVALSYGDRIRYFHKPNGHVASALNFGIRHMTGEYLSWLSHDDYYPREKVAQQVAALSRLDKNTVLYGDFEIVDVASSLRTVVRLPDVPPERFRAFITMQSSLHGCTLLLPRCCFEDCGTFNERLRTTQDYDLWFRVAAKYPFVHLPEILVTARSHPGQGHRQLRGVALKERNELLAGFVRQLSPAELEAEFGAPLHRAYFQIALVMQGRGLVGPRDAATELGRLGLGPEAWLQELAARVRWSAQLAATSVRRNRARAIRVLGRACASLRISRSVSPLQLGIQKRFSAIYRGNEFGGEESRSGGGSSLAQTAAIRTAIPALLSDLSVRVLLDVPCGDFHWMQHVQLPDTKYVGGDVVKELVDENCRRYAGRAREFVCLDIARDQLPPADLILCRDCLVHLPFEQSLAVLRNFRRSGAHYALITTFPNTTENVDLGMRGMWRPLNLNAPPFNLPAPLRLIVEGCTEAGGAYRDKSLGLWELSKINSI